MTKSVDPIENHTNILKQYVIIYNNCLQALSKTFGRSGRKQVDDPGLSKYPLNVFAFFC